MHSAKTYLDFHSPLLHGMKRANIDRTGIIANDRVQRMLRDALKKLAGNLLPTRLCDRFTAHAVLRREFKSLRNIPSQANREKLWDFAIQKIGPDKRLLLLEFGVWEGHSIHYFSNRFTNPQSRLIGCDSFEGLPESWGTIPAGGFSTGGHTPETKDMRVQFVRGWFQNTFEETITLARDRVPNPEAILIHFDAHLYSSTLFLLSQLYNNFDRYYFIFDEFSGDEARALYNFQQAYGSRVEFLSYHNRDNSTLPSEVFGVLDNRMSSYRCRGTSERGATTAKSTVS